MTNLLGSIRLAAYAFPLIAALVAVPFFDRQVRARCFNWVRTVFGGLFLFYVLCVLALVFFPLPDAAQAARLSGHEIQLVPFQFVADFLRETPLVLSDARTYLPALFDRTVLQVVCNILMLLPFGMYLRYVCGLDLGKVALVSLAFSAFIELGQLTGLFFMFRGSYRLCDVDDLMLNTLGGLLGGELVHLLWPTLLTGKLRYLHLLAPMEALPRSWPLLRLPLLLLLALPLVGWGLISAGRPRARLLIVFPLGAAVILDLCFMFLHAIRGAARWMPAELGFAVLEGLPLLGYAVLVLLCLRYWQPK